MSRLPTAHSRTLAGPPSVLITAASPKIKRSVAYPAFRRLMDILFVIVAAPTTIILSIGIACLNPALNPGPLFFRQKRMGKNGREFYIWKYRTMLPSPSSLRPHNATLEESRITPLGRALRTTRIDEVPNFINVLKGEMTLIGPRADAWEHAIVHRNLIKGYKDRFRVRPGITGLAQVSIGYAETATKIQQKARLDNFYIEKAGISLDLLILWRTLHVLLTGYGAK